MCLRLLFVVVFVVARVVHSSAPVFDIVSMCQLIFHSGPAHYTRIVFSNTQRVYPEKSALLHSQPYLNHIIIRCDKFLDRIEEGWQWWDAVAYNLKKKKNSQRTHTHTFLFKMKMITSVPHRIDRPNKLKVQLNCLKEYFMQFIHLFILVGAHKSELYFSVCFCQFFSHHLKLFVDQSPHAHYI